MVCIIKVIGIRCIYSRIRIVFVSHSIVACRQWLCLGSMSESDDVAQNLSKPDPSERFPLSTVNIPKSSTPTPSNHNKLYDTDNTIWILL